jgi:Ca2+/Na+ antiporter
VVISIPVYFAGKALTGGRSDFGDAMGATLGGAIGYFVVSFGVSYFLGTVIGNSAGALAFLLALIAWLAIYRAAFRTSWIRAIGIVVLAWFILVVIDYVMLHAFNVTFPNFIPFT